MPKNTEVVGTTEYARILGCEPATLARNLRKILREEASENKSITRQTYEKYYRLVSFDKRFQKWYITLRVEEN